MLPKPARQGAILDEFLVHKDATGPCVECYFSRHTIDGSGTLGDQLGIITFHELHSGSIVLRVLGIIVDGPFWPCIYCIGGMSGRTMVLATAGRVLVMGVLLVRWRSLGMGTGRITFTSERVMLGFYQFLLLG